MDPRFERIELDTRHCLYSGRLPAGLKLDTEGFEALWSLHPPERHEIRVHHRWVKTPRWQQAYGRSYVYSGTRSDALPIPETLDPLLGWCRQAIDPRLDGVLLNWYDGSLGHYISAHRDSRRGLIKGSPIVTISFGEARPFRMRPYRGKGYRDFDAVDAGVFVMPYETNLAWTHEVPGRKKHRGRRISVTVRAFSE